MELSSSQLTAFTEIVNGKSGLLTGTAGSGKTFLVNHVIQTLVERRKKVVHTATTGIAALLIQGVTLHSYMKIFPDDFRSKDGVAGVLRRMQKDKRRWLKACQDKMDLDTLIIDEASMLDIQTFEWVDEILQAMRGSGKPFGGVQVVLVGDFYQLPPISSYRGATYIFESKRFWELADGVWELTEVFRQKDPSFCGLLNRARKAELNEDDIKMLESRKGVVFDASEKIKPTKIFAKNFAVDELNSKELAKLETESQYFDAVFGLHEIKSRSKSAGKAQNLVGKTEFKEKQLDYKDTLPEKILKDVNLPKRIELKEGAQVMLCFNLNPEEGFVNGSRGVIVGFKESNAPTSEGFHRQYTESDLKSGMGRMIYPSKKLVPVVEFSNGKRFLMPMVRWTRHIPGVGEAYVWHFPLRLAWAVSIHRVQGQTLSRIEVSLDSSIFEPGQAFVAISRAESLEGIGITRFDPSCFKVDEKVKNFYSIPFMVQKFNMLKRPPASEASAAKTLDAPDSPSPPVAKKQRVVDADEFVIV